MLAVLTTGCRWGGDREAGPVAPLAPPTAAPSTGPGAGGGSLAPASRTPVAGFGEVAYRVSGSMALRCALLAETAAQRSRGLMNQTSLSGYDGMLFVFESDTRGAFWMKDTPLPLSIAWFDASGRLVSTADMEPCLGGGDCPLYPPTGPYRYALEVAQGGLAPLGVEPGSTITIGGACP